MGNVATFLFFFLTDIADKFRGADTGEAYTY